MPRSGNPNNAPWTAEDDEVMRQHYRKLGAGGVQPLLSVQRTRHAIVQRAQRLGVPRKRHWSKRDDQKLTWLWESGLRLVDISKRLGRTRSAAYRRAQDLGLKIGAPSGFEYVTQAAHRCGFDVDTMWRILEAGSVKLHQTLSDPRLAGKGNWRRHYVDPECVDEAVAAWLSCELVEQAAQRRGLVAVTLRTWLVKAGALPTERRKVQERVASDVIDRVIAQHRRAA